MTTLRDETVSRSSLLSDGAGLKYPAVKVQREPAYAGWARRSRMRVSTGSSVDVSGRITCDICASMYTRVSASSASPGPAASLCDAAAADGDIRRSSVAVVLLTKALGCCSGEGAELLRGQVSAKPAGSSDGSTRKLKDATPLWMFQK